jgi:DICT domain-containing protein
LHSETSILFNVSEPPGDEWPLSLGDLASRTGVPPATLRTWQSRYAFPVGSATEGARRRYRLADLRQIEEVVRLRRSGLGVATAIATVVQAPPPAIESFFAHLRTYRPDLEPAVLPKRILSALSWAVEDEYCSRAIRPLLFAGFQRQALYRPAETRWRELSRTAEATVIFADFEQVSEPSPRLLEVPLAADAPARREWILICDSPDSPACVTGWELANPGPVPDAERRFETLWSLEPAVVREATRIGLGLVARIDPGRAQQLHSNLPPAGATSSADLRRANGLFSRILTYLDQPTYRAGVVSRSPPAARRGPLRRGGPSEPDDGRFGGNNDR